MSRMRKELTKAVVRGLACARAGLYIVTDTLAPSAVPGAGA